MAKKAATKCRRSQGGRPSGDRIVEQTRDEGRDLHQAGDEDRTVQEAGLHRLRRSLTELIGNELGKKGPGLFVVPGLLKLKVVRKPATKAKTGINPFTKEPMTYKAKPARNVVKALPLKSLKEMV